MVGLRSLSLIFLIGTGLAISPRPVGKRQDPSGTTSAENPVSTICGDIINDVNNGFRVFFAEAAFSCLASVPFNHAVALRFIDYYNTTMEFQSTLSYIKNPPEGYQQPPFDFFESLKQLKHNVVSGAYKNQYAFETDLQHIIYQIHDSHVDLYGGVLSSFSFASPYELVTASVDGKEAPKVYLKGDILARQQNGTDISPIATINGEDVVEYLTGFAALHSVGMLEPHADWNQLMASPIQDFQGGFSSFSGGASFYPGDPALGYYGDALNFTFADSDAVLNDYYLAVYTNPDFTGPLTTGGDYYNYFVLGFLPASINEVEIPASFILRDEDDSDDTSAVIDPNWTSASNGAFPDDPVIVQSNLDAAGGGVVTGYFLDGSTGVLSIPFFDQFGENIGTFADAVSSFIGNATEQSISKVIIDLQQNTGGTSFLAFTTFKSFFPDVDTFAGSRRRSHPLADALGSTVTNYWESLPSDNETKFSLEADEWVITTRLNAETGGNFTSWAEYFGPIDDNGDLFSLIERYDLANSFFDQAAFDGWEPVAYTEGTSGWPTPWAPEDIVILTDGACSSACALFVELMTREAGVKTIVVGGNPAPGPMQTTGGSRGATLYSSYSLDDDFTQASNYSDEIASRLPTVRDTGMYVTYASVNLRDQMREGETVPLQFQYLAADCRIWYTLDNVYNMTALWLDAARATWEDPTLCVEGSTGFSSSRNKTAEKSPPPAAASSVAFSGVQFTQDYNLEESNGLPAGGLPAGKPAGFKLCDPKKAKTDCGLKQDCAKISFSCSNKSKKEANVCVNRCQTVDNYCPTESEYCFPKSTSESNKGTSNVNTKSAAAGLKTLPKPGHCLPYVGTAALGCPVN